MTSILIGGDVCPIGKNLDFFTNGDACAIFNDLLKEFEKADLSIINLECPLIEKDGGIQKNGPVLGVESDCINALKEAKIDVINLANNHILDHGPQGLQNTLKICSDVGISTVGAGKDLKAARRMLIKRVGKIRVGILAVAEHEFSIATASSWGANPLDIVDFVRNVKSEKMAFDYLIVLLHGGNENYPYPSPRLKDIAHFMVEVGANAVIVQHTHCAGCYENYQNGHIVYGQGNLIFNWPRSDKSFNEGFLVKLSVKDDFNSTMEVIPFEQSEFLAGVRRMRHEYKQGFLKALEERSKLVKDDNFVETQWHRFCKVRKYGYLSRLLGFGRTLSRINRYGLIINCFYPTKLLLRIQNLIQCEAHREVLETIFTHR